MELLMDQLDPELEGMPLRVLIQLDQLMVPPPTPTI